VEIRWPIDTVGVMSARLEALDIDVPEKESVVGGGLEVDDLDRLEVVMLVEEKEFDGEAARVLGWPTGSMSGRLALARELLRKQLVSRGLALSAGVFAILLSKNACAVVVPDSLLDCTVRGAVLFARDTRATASFLSPSVSSLTEEVLEELRLSSLKRKIAGLLALLVLVLFGVIGAMFAYASLKVQVCS
jgi:hypothetical protein